MFTSAESLIGYLVPLSFRDTPDVPDEAGVILIRSYMDGSTSIYVPDAGEILISRPPFFMTSYRIADPGPT